MSDTLMTADATTTGSADQQTASTETETDAATTEANQQQSATTEDGTDTSTETKTDGDGTDGDTVKTGAPEAYTEFTMPDGVTLSDDLTGQIKDFAKRSNLTQEQAQELATLAAERKAGDSKAAQEAATQAVEQAKAQWMADAKGDKEFGGDKLGENLSFAKKALDQFGTPELRTLLDESGLGNHPEVIRLMVRAGKAISEDRIVTSGQASPGQRDAAKVLYPNQ